MKPSNHTSLTSKITTSIFKLINRLQFYGIDNYLLVFAYFLSQTIVIISLLSLFIVQTQLSSSILKFNQQIISLIYINKSSRFEQLQAYSFSLIITSVTLAVFISCLIILLSEDKQKKQSKFSFLKLYYLKSVAFVFAIINLPMINFLSSYIINLLKDQQILLIPLPLLSMILLVAYCLIMQQLANQVDFKNITRLSRIHQKEESVLLFVRFGLAIGSNYSQLGSSNINWLCLLISLYLIGIQLHSSLCTNKYLNKITQYLHLCKLVLSMSFGLTTLLLQFFYQQFQSTNNFILTCLFLFAIGMTSLRSYIHYRRCMLTSKYQVQTPQEAVSFMMQMLSMLNQAREQNDLIKINFLKAHMQTCQNVTCLCHNKILYTTSSLAIHNPFFMVLILQKLQKLKNEYNDTFQILSIYLSYKLSIMGYFSKVQSSIRGYQHKKEDLSLSERYIMKQLQWKVQNEVDQINFKSGHLKLQFIFQQQKIKKQLVRLIQELNQNQIAKYRILSQSNYSLNIIEQICSVLNNKITAIQSIIYKFAASDSYSIEIYELILFYLQGVMPSSIEAQQLSSTIMNKMESLRQLRGIKKENLGKYLYTNRACIIESSLEQPIGLIRNITKTCQEMFEIPREKVIGQDVHFLMPSFFVKGHRERVAKWLANQSFASKLAGFLEVYYVSKNFKCFSGIIHLKIMTDGLVLKLYVLIVMDNDQDYLIMNAEGQIQGCGNRLYSQNIFQKRHIGEILLKSTNVNLIEKIKMQNQYHSKITIIRRFEVDSKQYLKMIDLQEDSENQRSLRVFFQCDVIIRKHNIGSTKYYTLKFISIQKHIQQNHQLLIPAKTFNAIKHHPIGLYNAVVNNPQIKVIGTNLEYQSIKMPLSHKTGKQNNTVISQNIIGYELPLKNIKNKIKKSMREPDSINQNAIQTIPKILGIICSLCLLSCWGLQGIYNFGTSSLSFILAGEGIANSNMHILQIIYSNLLAIQNHCKSSNDEFLLNDYCQYISNSNNMMTQRFYSLLVADTKGFLKNQSYISQIYFRQNLQELVDLKIGNTITEVSTFGFVQHYYHSLIIVNQHISKLSHQINSIQGQQSIQFLIDNWDQIQIINHKVTEFYQQTMNVELNIIVDLLLTNAAVFIALLIGMMIVACRYVKNKQNQKIEVLYLHTWINRKTANREKQYFQKIKLFLKDQQFKAISSAPIQDSLQRNRGDIKYIKQNYHVLLLLFVGSLFIGIMILMMSKVYEVMNPLQKTVGTMNKLIDIQKNQIQSYLQLKTFVLFSNQSKNHAEHLIQDSSQYLQSNQISFISQCQASLAQFSTFDSTFAQDYNSLLLQNICNQSNSLFYNWQIEYCQHVTQSKYFHKNILIQMNVLQRKSLSGIIRFINDKQNGSEAFDQKIYKDIDGLMMFTFQAFQALHTRIIEGLQRSFSSFQPTLTIINSFLTLMLVLVFSGSCINKSRQKSKMANLLGIILQMPEQVLLHKNVMMILKQKMAFLF